MASYVIKVLTTMSDRDTDNQSVNFGWDLIPTIFFLWLTTDALYTICQKQLCGGFPNQRYYDNCFLLFVRNFSAASFTA